jgi:pSer/pThr/pTyr-binding forkhead associated (FHA) protein
MAKLILSMDGLVLKEVQLTKERTTIGRRPHNDIVIDNLAVSGEHAVIVTILNDSFLEDLGSTNGTMVNGQPIKKHFLQTNDVIELGKYKLKYLTENKGLTGEYDKAATRSATAPQNTPAPSAADMVAPSNLTPAYTQRPPAPPSPSAGSQALSSGPAQKQACVQILNGANAGKELMLTKALTTLGRPGVQVAVITRRPQGYFITHVEGGHHPVVNGKTLGAEAYALSDHDVIELSGTKMEFFFKG